MSLIASGRTPDFPELVELARTSPWLQCAFDPIHREEVDRIVPWIVRDEVLFALGLARKTKRERPSIALIEQFFEETTTSALTDYEVFLGLTAGLSHAIRQYAPIPEKANEWIADYLQGKIVCPPKKRGRHRLINSERDMHINYHFRDMKKLGVRITENDGTYQEASAAHAIIEALGDFYPVPNVKTLMNIWSSRSRH